MPFSLFQTAQSVWAKPIASTTTLQSSLPPVPDYGAPKRPFGGAGRFSPPPPPPDFGAPGRRGGGAGRGCSAGGQSVTALVPEYKQTLTNGEITRIWGTTTAERPTIWFDVPYQANQIATMEFVLQDNARPVNKIYRAVLTPPTTPGIIAVGLPESVPPLKVGTPYEWFLKVSFNCGSGLHVPKEKINGWIQRVAPSASLMEQLNQGSPQQQLALLTENGFWYDAVTTLAQLRQTNPQDATLTNDWNLLLQSVGLQTLSTKPLVNCCSPQGDQKFTPPKPPPRLGAPGLQRSAPAR